MLAARFEGIPDVHGDDDHFACADRGVSEWTINGRTVDGEHIDVCGCGPWAFDAKGKIVLKHSSGRSARRDEFGSLRAS